MYLVTSVCNNTLIKLMLDSSQHLDMWIIHDTLITVYSELLYCSVTLLYFNK